MRGFTLVEIAVALALAAVVAALVGSLFVASLSAWRRGSDQREAQIQASTLAEMMARDIRAASQAPGVVLRPDIPGTDGEPVAAIAQAGSSTAGGAPGWVLYVHNPERREILRQTAAVDPDGRLTLGEARVVATGVERVKVTEAGGGTTIEVQIRRGREVVSHRATAAPRNP